jgi:hypothetical protein
MQAGNERTHVTDVRTVSLSQPLRSKSLATEAEAPGDEAW